MSPTGLIGLFVRHRNAANLLAGLAIVIGLFSITRLNTQFFPDFGIDFVSVTLAWPGASAEDVEANIVAAVEPEVRFLSSVKKVVSFAVEGSGIVLVEFEAGTNMQSALSDVESAVGQITTFPEDAERPIVRRIVRYDTISRLVISGPIPEAALKKLAKRLRDDLLSIGVDQVEMFGAREEEIWVEIAPETLRRLDLTLADVGARIAGSSQDLPLGTMEGSFEKQIRSLGLATDAAAVGAIEVRALETGEKIFVRDIARVTDTFKEDDEIAVRGGLGAIELHIQRSASADALEQARLVNDYVERVRPTLPPDLRFEHYDVQAALISDRINLLLRNGASGLALVLLVLFIFLSGRLAFWVAAGIPIALMATMAAMLASGQSINMVSLFALIMTLGIIVDDAIVVGEHSATLRTRGLGPLAAAEGGALKMLAPVTAASLTTIAAFLPILMIGDVIGQIIAAIPYVVVAVLVASLAESFLILPAHVRDAMRRGGGPESRFRRWFDDRFGQFRDGVFAAAVAAALRWRYLTLSLAVGCLVVSVGLVVSGRLAFNFFPSPEADVVFANILYPPGTPRSETERMIAELERALEVAEAKLTGGAGGLVVMSFGKVGRSQAEAFQSVKGDHLGGVHVELVPSDSRSIRTPEFIEAWRDEIVPLAGVERISLNERQGGPPGREIDVRLSGGSTAVLKEAALAVRDALREIPGVSDIEDDLPYGKQEVELSLTTKGRALGFTTESVGRQVRDAFEGRIAKRFARGDEEVVVRVQYPRGAVGAGTLRDLYVRGPGGAEVALSELVQVRETRGFARVRREDGVREVAVTAEVDETTTTNNEVLATLSRTVVPEIAARFGIAIDFAGKAEEQRRTLADMRTGAIIALVFIYIILAWVFASYSRPFVVMAIIPFGFVGAILGHLVMGYNLTILSLIALLGLAGILVNDSIILVRSIEERIDGGQPAHAAIVGGASDRLRAVLLTSLTTIGGLLPLMFETSLQARFLIPMAITIVFGLALATLLVLVLIPALVGIQEDVKRLMRRRASAAVAAAE